MIINLSEQMAQHFDRVINLAKEAEMDEAQSYASRSSAMSAVTVMLKELEKSQDEIINMERLMRIERITVEVVKEFLTPDQFSIFLDRLEEVINAR